ncbi:MAG: arylamine N-acetyltransferase [Acidobacteria bacterium]|nr:arylamine N-acetyltransferase [Acidobacteriota bacterium]
MDVLEEFLRHFGLAGDGPPRRVLGETTAAFARLPYENVTKILKHAACGTPEKARRAPEEVLADHKAWGTGGTCFSLTATLLCLVRALGWRAAPILADRPYGPDTHCALVVWIDGVPHLVDPGYLIFDPLPLEPGGDREFTRGRGRLDLSPDGAGGRIGLATIRGGTRTHRLTYKTAPVDRAQFHRAWDASFGWEMMRYPLLVRAAESGHVYVRGSMLQITRGEATERTRVPEREWVERVAAEFRMAPALLARALSILAEREADHGTAAGR